MSRSINLHPPKAFDGSPSNWITWSKRFDRYYKGTNLAERSREEQISIFLYTMGECAEDILTTLKIDENDAEVTYETLMTAFDDFFDQRKNVIVDRAKFNKRVQKEGESIDTFIQDLHKLADECNYGPLKEELIRDRIVVGVMDDDLSLELQSKAKLTLTEAIQLSSQAEARKESQSIIRDKKEAVDYVKRGHYNPHKRNESRPAEKCKRFGKGPHSQRDRQRQPSLKDSSSSDESLQIPNENTSEREMRRQNKEIDNFINLLDNTLKMNTEIDRSEDEELVEIPLDQARPLTAPWSRHSSQLPTNNSHRHKPAEPPQAASKPPAVEKGRKISVPAEQPAPPIHKSSSMPSVETLTSTSRLLDRIRLLHKDCVQGVGYPVLKKAYDILDLMEEDNVEPKLLELLGPQKFDEYAGKIWQLKFCEESFFTT